MNGIEAKNNDLVAEIQSLAQQREEEKAKALEESGVLVAEFRAFGTQTESVRVLEFIRTQDVAA